VPTLEGQHACKLIDARWESFPTLSDDELTTAGSPGQKSTASQDQARHSGTDDGPWDCNTEGEQLGSKLSTKKIRIVDVKVGVPAFDSRDQRRLGLLQPALHGDEHRIVERRILQTKERGEIGALRHSQREPGKRWHRGRDADVGAGHRLATMDVRRRAVQKMQVVVQKMQVQQSLSFVLLLKQETQVRRKESNHEKVRSMP
jgi:hypothetical protein